MKTFVNFLSNFFRFRSHHKAKVMASKDARKVLLLGAGMVSDPLAHYYSSQQSVKLTVASDSSRDGQRLAGLGDNIDSVVVDVQKEPDVIDQLIGYVVFKNRFFCFWHKFINKKYYVKHYIIYFRCFERFWEIPAFLPI